jgi:hypothetical protein
MAAGRLTGGILSPWSCDDQHFRTLSPDRLRDQRLVEGELARRDGGRLARDDDRGLLVVRRLLEQQGVGLIQMNQQIEKSRGQLFLKSCSSSTPRDPTLTYGSQSRKSRLANQGLGPYARRGADPRY